MNFHRHSDYLRAYHSLTNELERPDLDHDAIDGLLQDLDAALCTKREDAGDEDEGYEDLDDFEPAYPSFLDYLNLNAALSDRAEDLTVTQRVQGQERLLEMLEHITDESD